MSTKLQHGIRKLFAVLGALTFVAFLWAPLYAMVTGTRIFESTGENRSLAYFPGAPESLEDIGPWRERFESFYDDRFGFRNALVQLHNSISVLVLNDPGSVPVALGKEGWLYLADDPSLPMFRRTQEPWTRSEMRSILASLLARRDFLARFGVEYAIVIAPAKSTIYPEFHDPKWTTLDRPSRREQFVQFVEGSGLRLLDLTECILAEKERLQREGIEATLYYRTDTHWNSRAGSLTAGKLRTWLEGQGIDMPEAQPIPDSAWISEPSPRGGDLARMLGIEHLVQSTRWTPRDGPPSHGLTALPLPAERRSFKFTDPKPTCTTKLLLLHDSFAEVWREYLPKGHPECTFLWEENLDLLRLAAHAPNVVIREMTERLFVSGSFENPVTLREIPAGDSLDAERAKWIDRSRSITVGDTLVLLGAELLDHGDNFELVLHFEARSPHQLTGRIRATPYSSEDEELAPALRVLCPLGSGVQKGYRWQQRVMLPGSGYARTAKLALEFFDEKWRQIELATDGAAPGRSVMLERSLARRSEHYSK